MSDYISRQAAIEALAGWKISPIVLDPVPSADVRENVRGEWLYKSGIGEPDKRRTGQICSVCGFRFSESGGWCINPPSFCPNCGADMRGEA